MPSPNQYNRNYRMRSNNTPPPARNPYLSFSELQKKSQAYTGQSVQQTSNDTDLPASEISSSDQENIFTMQSQSIGPDPAIEQNQDVPATYATPRMNGTPMNGTPMNPMPRMNGTPMNPTPPMNPGQRAPRMNERERIYPRMNGQNGWNPRQNNTERMDPRMNGQNGMNPMMNDQNGIRPRMNDQNMIRPRMNGQNGMNSTRTDQTIQSPAPAMQAPTPAVQMPAPAANTPVTDSQERVPDSATQMNDMGIPATSPDRNTWELLASDSLANYSDDLSYFLRMSPTALRILLKEIQKELDSIDYSGSLIYDQYPDRTTIFRIVDIIYDRVLPHMEHTPLTDIPGDFPASPVEGQIPPEDSQLWLRHVIFLLIIIDIIARRDLKKPNT